MRFRILSTGAGVLLFVFAGCGTQSVYLQNIQVDGPLGVPPVFIVGEEQGSVGTFRLAVSASAGPDQKIEGRADGHTDVNAAGVYQVDTVRSGGSVEYIEREGVNTRRFEGTNFRWTLVPLTLSLQGDIQVARSLSLVGGLQYSSNRSRSYLGGMLGMGFSFYGSNIGVRIDLGAMWTEVHYDVDYVVTTRPFLSSDTYVQFFSDEGRSFGGNLYGAVMLNTRNPSWPLHLFVQMAIMRQTVVDLDREVYFPRAENVRASVLHHNSFFTVTPGVVVPLAGSGRVVLGIRLTDETALLVGEPGVLLAPFAHVEFTL
jgi:hypothetical protein